MRSPAHVKPAERALTEPDVALTDFALAVECALLARLLGRAGPAASRLRVTFVVFFASIGASALAGGAMHGFCLEASGAGHRLLWPATLLGIGVTAAAAWIAGARMLLRPPFARVITWAAALGFAAYAARVLSGSQEFRVAVLFYLPAALFLTIAHLVLFVRTRAREIGIGLAGLGLSFAAAFVQQARVALHPVYFTHNAVYHVLQGIALFLIFLGARRLARDETETHKD
jgi:hypothetical protein